MLLCGLFKNLSKIKTEENTKMKNLLLVFCVLLFLILGCSSSDNNSNGRSATPSTFSSSSPTSVKSTPKSFGLDVAGQLARINDEGYDDEQISKNIADVNKEITFEHLKKNADKYAGKAWGFKGKILEISEDNGGTIARIALDD